MTEEQAELNLLVHGLGFSMDEFLELADTPKEDELVEGHLLKKFAEALLTIANLQLIITKHDDEVQALHLRLDLMDVPRDCTESEIIL